MDENSNNNATAEPMSVNALKPKMKLTGTVKRLELYGAFIDIGVGTNALIHISKLGPGHVNRVSDVLNEGDEVTVWVEKVSPDRDQVMLTMVEPLEVEWNDLKVGQTYTGTVKRLENYGAFVDIGAEREGLVHISEISHDYVKHPSEALSVGDEVQVQVLGFSRRKRRIDLSIKSLLDKPEAAASYGGAQYESPSDGDVQEEVFEEMPTAMEIAFREAMGDDSIDAIEKEQRRRRTSKKNKRRNRRQAQEDALSRTLQLQNDNS